MPFCHYQEVGGGRSQGRGHKNDWTDNKSTYFHLELPLFCPYNHYTPITCKKYAKYYLYLTCSPPFQTRYHVKIQHAGVSLHGEQLAKLFQNPPINDEFTVQTRRHARTYMYLKLPLCQLSWTLSVTLTFELGTLVLCMTHRLHMVNISA